MPTLAQLGDLPVLLSDSLLSKSPLWNRQIKVLKPLDLALFIRLHKGTSNYLKAIREIDTLKEHVWLNHVDKGTSSADLDLLNHESPREQFTSGDLVSWLETTTMARRRALIFALEMNLEPRKVIDLEWRDLQRMRLTLLASELTTMQPRHIRLSYVFWDTLPNGSAAPLFGLHETALEVSQGLGMSVMQKLYDGMTMVDSDADVRAFDDDLKSILAVQSAP